MDQILQLLNYCPFGGRPLIPGWNAPGLVNRPRREVINLSRPPTIEDGTHHHLAAALLREMSYCNDIAVHTIQVSSCRLIDEPRGTVSPGALGGYS